MRQTLTYRPFGSLRLCLALLVVAQHFMADVGPQALADIVRPFALGGTAVLVFFILSGFIIFESADRIYQGRPLEFITNRLIRIVPPFLVSVTLIIITSAVLFAFNALEPERDGPIAVASDFSARNIAANIFGFLPLVDKAIGYNFLDVAWTLRVEFLFYISITAALAAASLLQRWRVTFAFASLVMLLAGIPIFAFSLDGHLPPSLQYIPYFTLGAALYVVLVRQDSVGVPLILTSMAGIWLQFWANPFSSWTQFDIMCGLLIVFILLVRVKVKGAKILDRKMGDVTYSLYLSHACVGVLFQSLTSRSTYVGLFAAFVLSLVLAIVLHRLVDPAIDRVRDRIRGAKLREPTMTAPTSAAVQA